MKMIIPLMAFAVAGCTKEIETNPVVSAVEYIGLQERQDRKVIKDFVGVDPVRTEWCAAFVNAVLELEGIPGSATVSDVPLMARSFLFWGEKVNPQDIKQGDIVIFPRGKEGWQGHVGFYVETQGNYWVILGGNQKNEVRYDLYLPRKALGIRRYKKEVDNP